MLWSPLKSRRAAAFRRLAHRGMIASRGGPQASRAMSRVLMVDDAGLFRLLEGSFLRRLGCEIVRAGGGSDLLDKARHSSPDLILLDADHPRLDGAECVRALKADPELRPTPVLLVTSPEDAVRCSDAGADATLARPLVPGALEVALSTVGRIGTRHGRRRGAWLAVRVALGDDGAACRRRAKDISRTGLFLALPGPLPLGTPLTMSMRLAVSGRPRRVGVRGIVVRHVTNDPDSHLIPGVGVRFVDLDPASAALIGGYVEEDPDAAGAPPRPPAGGRDSA